MSCTCKTDREREGERDRASRAQLEQLKTALLRVEAMDLDKPPQAARGQVLVPIPSQQSSKYVFFSNRCVATVLKDLALPLTLLKQDSMQNMPI